MDKVISFPTLDNYSIPAYYVLSHISKLKIIKPPKITNKTVELGTKYSPDFVCTPFKYTLGTLLEVIEKGANTLFQFGGGCRYGYYGELQRKIIKDLGYDVSLDSLIIAGKTDLKRIYKLLKKYDPSIKLFKSIYYSLIGISMVIYMDKLDDYIRRNVGFEVSEGSFELLKENMLEELSSIKGYFSLRKVYKKYRKLFKKIEIDKPKDCIKVGLIGELYTLMESSANYDIEKDLAKHHIQIKRYTNVSYLLFKKRRKVKKSLKKLKNIKYRMGADAVDNVYNTKELCEKGYDGIIHIKSSFCTPEIGAMPIINKVAKEYGVPVIFFSFDTNTSEVGIKTRLEAFYDMLEMRKNNE